MNTIYQKEAVKKTKFLYIINVLSYCAIAENSEDWYRAASCSVGVKTKRCGSANVPDDWKNKADAIKLTQIK